MVCETVMKNFYLLIAQLSYIWACLSRTDKLNLNIHTFRRYFYIVCMIMWCISMAFTGKHNLTEYYSDNDVMFSLLQLVNWLLAKSRILADFCVQFTSR